MRQRQGSNSGSLISVRRPILAPSLSETGIGVEGEQKRAPLLVSIIEYYNNADAPRRQRKFVLPQQNTEDAKTRAETAVKIEGKHFYIRISKQKASPSMLLPP